MIKTREELNLLYIEDEDKLFHAIMIDEVEGNDETRQAILDIGNPELAYYFAYNVDCMPRDDTRNLVCKSQSQSFWYALNIDRCPRDDTRSGVCAGPAAEYAYHYARFVDHCPRSDTREAVQTEEYWKREYEEWEKSLQEKK